MEGGGGRRGSGGKDVGPRTCVPGVALRHQRPNTTIELDRVLTMSELITVMNQVLSIIVRWWEKEAGSNG